MRNEDTIQAETVYNNALPYHLNKADLCRVDQRESAFAAALVRELLVGRSPVVLDTREAAADKIRHLYFHSRNQEKVYGYKSFGLGYPLYVDTFRGELSVAPLLIWHLGMEPAQGSTRSWVLRRTSAPVACQLNMHLRELIQEKYGVDLAFSSKEREASRQGGGGWVAAFVRRLAERLQAEEQGSWEEPVPSPGIDRLGAYTHRPALCWSGVLSQYPPQYPTGPADQEEPAATWPAGEAITAKEPFVFGWHTTTPEEQTALERAHAHPVSAVTSDDGNSLNRTAANLILNALANGQRCLVVADRAPVLRQVQQWVVKSGLLQQHFLMLDGWHDSTTLGELLRVSAKGASAESEIIPAHFQEEKNRYLRSKERMDAAYRAVRSAVFGESDWTDTVGRFLASQRIEGRELLGSQLGHTGFELSQAEYAEIRDRLGSCQALFPSVNTLGHPLTVLHSDWFREDKEPVEDEALETSVLRFLERTQGLHYRYLRIQEAVLGNWRTVRLHAFEQLSEQIRAVRENIYQYEDRYGTSFRTAGAGKLVFMNWFRLRRRVVREAVAEVTAAYLAVMEQFRQSELFPFEFRPSRDGRHIGSVRANLEALEAALLGWRESLDSSLQDAVMRLDSRQQDLTPSNGEELQGLERELEDLLSDLQEAGLFQQKFERPGYSVRQQQRKLESLSELLETTAMHLRDFQAFHAWQTVWLSLTGKGRQVVGALVKARPADWTAAFDSWFFSQLLRKERPAGLPTADHLAKDTAERWAALRPLLVPQIRRIWQARREAALRKLKKENKTLYVRLFVKGVGGEATDTPAEQFRAGWETISEVLPVLLTTPEAAAGLLQERKTGLYDQVLILTAGGISVDKAAELSSYGRRTALFSLPAEDGVLVAYLRERGLPVTHLPDIPVWEDDNMDTSVRPRWQVDAVDGRYSEAEDTNDTEAQFVVRLLNQVKPTPQQVYPTVGIVTMTRGQRDRILQYLLEVKQRQPMVAEKIGQLERNGLVVLHLEEALAYPMDHVVLSGTFGVASSKRNLTKRTEWLNTPQAGRMLRWLAKAQVSSMHLVHSFSENHLHTFSGKQQERGTWILSHLIQAGKACQAGNRHLFREIWQLLGFRTASRPVPSIFAEECRSVLEDRMDRGLLQAACTIGTVVVPLLVHPTEDRATGRPVVVVPDGFFARAACTSAVWEESRRIQLTAKGYEVLNAWSVRWLEDPGQEGDGLFRALRPQGGAQPTEPQAGATVAPVTDRLER